MKTTGIQSLRKELDQKAIEISNLALQLGLAEDKLGRLQGDIFNLCNGDKLLDGADNNACILESYITTLKEKAAADRHQIQKLQSTVAELENANHRQTAELADIYKKIIDAFNRGRKRTDAANVPNALQTNPGDENY